ncbi:helix-turn-helix domain-containing protein [Pleionea sp. CnH1-48]|uniref:helix-turn-helix domain-containing protein n=1 Tax=Pleionea sp. CnH1-48 TaxID=2954494 RepID=UPI002096A3E7|nr:AraC family transcriptional regulator [Pleionea sp. CnH1-48]MCO7224584.1 AraC family transcriptional regulator [Pleionea sp. CnH1-48]
MTEKNQPPYALVPEIALLDSLPEHLQKRFADALELMHYHLEDGLSWEQIANKSAISPYHFHRQFCQLFNETPGQYHSRMRLQNALHYLLHEYSYSITDIAHRCGFSSSQALGKALKRELGMTAKAIRILGQEGTAEETSLLLEKVAHPDAEFNLENTLADKMPTELVWYPQRGMKILLEAESNLDWVIEHFGSKATRFMNATPIKELTKSWQEMETFVGDWQCDPKEYDVVIAEGYYLCSEVYLFSDVAYYAACESLFIQAEKKKLKLDESGLFVEIIRDLDESPNGGMTFSFQIPIIDQDEQ